MNTRARSLLIFLLVIACLPAFSQDSLKTVDPQDSIFVEQDGKPIPIESYASRYDPRKAILLAAVFPGAGQIYNKKYWKLPLVYGGFIGIGYAVWWNQDRYLFYRQGLFSLLNDGSNPQVIDAQGNTRYGNRVINGKLYHPVGDNGFLSLEVARTAVNKFRRDRDYSLIMCFLFYIMQMVDAHVDAHLKEFDLNPQLKVSIEPVIKQSVYFGRANGFGLTLKF
jgi:hypothetical protein